MVYIIISNIGLAIMMIYIYLRYSHFRITSSKEIAELRSKNDSQTNELRDFDAKFLSSIKSYQDRVESLLIEVGKVRQEKEKEIELRTQIEKKFEVLHQKNIDYETIHGEITNAILNIVNDTHETAKNLGEDLYEKISTSYKKELQESQKIISKINQNVSEFVEKFGNGNAPIKNKNDDSADLLRISNNPIAKNTYLEAVQIFESKNFKINKNYFALQNTNQDGTKIMVGDLAFINHNKLYILDFKGTSYIFEYFALKAKNDKNAENLFDFIFKKYLTLLSDKNYYNETNRLLNYANIVYDSYQIIIVVPSLSEIKLLKDLKFYDMAQRLNIDIFDTQNFTKIL